MKVESSYNNTFFFLHIFIYTKELSYILRNILIIYLFFYKKVRLICYGSIHNSKNPAPLHIQRYESNV